MLLQYFFYFLFFLTYVEQTVPDSAANWAMQQWPVAAMVIGLVVLFGWFYMKQLKSWKEERNEYTKAFIEAIEKKDDQILEQLNLARANERLQADAAIKNAQVLERILSQYTVVQDLINTKIEELKTYIDHKIKNA